MASIVLVKLGGSIITDKSQEMTPRNDEINRLLLTLVDVFKDDSEKQLILVHGAGSWAHPLAAKYSLKGGYVSPTQIRGVAETHRSMERLNSLILDPLLRMGAKPFAFPPSSMYFENDNEPPSFFLKSLKKALSLGLLPILYGDVVFSSSKGHTILSGDTILRLLSEEFQEEVEKVILATDVDGVFDKDPSKFQDANLINKINIAIPEDLVLLEKIIASKIESEGEDVTGKMTKKLEEAKLIANMNIPVYILNALEGNRLRDCILDKKVLCTVITNK